MHIHHLPLGFLAMMTFASRSGYLIGLMTSASSSLLTLDLAPSALSLDILLSFCFLSLTDGSTFSACSMMSLLIPHKSFADQAKNISVASEEGY